MTECKFNNLKTHYWKSYIFKAFKIFKTSQPT